jgi:ATP-dependent Clp protease ATP-binding subunit ClpB
MASSKPCGSVTEAKFNTPPYTGVSVSVGVVFSLPTLAQLGNINKLVITKQISIGTYLFFVMRHLLYFIAHPDVFNLLLQILDDGRLTDGHGRTVDFKNTILIMTSNVGSQFIQELQGKDEEEMKRRVLASLRAQFRPEFLNRIDEIVIFHSLSLEQLKQIVEIQFTNLRKRLAERRLEIELSDSAKELLAKEGFDPVYGARPLKRAIQRLIQDPLSLKLLQGEFKEGDFVEVDRKGDELIFRRRKG